MNTVIILKKALKNNPTTIGLNCSKKELKDKLLHLLYVGDIEEDGIYVGIDSSMIRNGKLFGFECKVPKYKNLEGQAIIKCRRKDCKFEFSVGFFFDNEYHDCVIKDIDYDTASNICHQMVNLGCIYNALCVPLYVKYNSYYNRYVASQ